MKKIFTLAVIAAASSAAMAQSDNFTGWSAGVNMNLNAASVKLEDTSGNSIDQFGNKSTYGASFQAAYGMATSSSGILTFGVNYSAMSNDIAKIELNGSGVTMKQKNAYSIYVEPGFKTSQDTLVYGKVSYEKAKFSAEDIPSGAEQSQSKSGTGIGFGMRTMLSKDMYMQVEVRHVTYSSITSDDGSTTFKPSNRIGTVGIGWRF